MKPYKEITVDVEAKLTVSAETADRCLRLVEMYLEDNEDKYIDVKLSGKKTTLRIIDTHEKQTR